MNPMIFWMSLLLLLLLGGGLAAALLMDSGYVWMVWQGWELQTSVAWLMVCLLLVWLSLSLSWMLLGGLWQWPQHYRRRHQSLLLQQQYDTLTHLVLAQTLDKQAYARQLASTLDQTPRCQLIQQQYGQLITPTLDEHHDISVLMRAQAAINAQQFDSVQPLLNCLAHWPEQANQDYLPPVLRFAYLAQLYQQWALQQPWRVLMLPAFQPAWFEIKQWKEWLQALYQQLDQASEEAWHALIQHYDQQEPRLQQALAADWLRLLGQSPAGQVRAITLGCERFRQQFCPTLMYDWLRSARSIADPLQITSLLNELQGRYVGQPAIHLAQAYWQVLQHDQTQAEQIVHAWPNQVLKHRLQALLSLDQLSRPSRLAAPLFVFESVEAEI
jgi:hypothetical protein